MSQTLTARLAMAAAMLALGTATAYGSIVTRTFTINTADIVDLYSATFDGALVPCNNPTPPPDAQECTFFNGYLPAGRQIIIAPTGTGTGTINVNYDTVTGEITQVNQLHIDLPKLTLVIQSTTTVTVDPTYPAVGYGPGTSAPPAAYYDIPFIEAGTATLGRDLDGVYAGTLLGQGTVDADQGVAIGQVAVFQHVDQSNVDVPDFAVFTDVVDTCVGPACPLITSGLLSLDGNKYRIEGTISCKSGGNALILKTQTANNSIYRVNFTAVTTEVDCDGDGVANAVPDNCPDEPNAGQADNDGDLRGNVCDNCIALSNNSGAGAQANSDADAFGNRCDGDINNNSTTNAQDYVLFRQQLGKPSIGPYFNRADINANGVINAQDYVLFRGLLGLPPGPGPGP